LINISPITRARQQDRFWFTNDVIVFWTFA
jgi:hypothetical protein